MKTACMLAALSVAILSGCAFSSVDKVAPEKHTSQTVTKEYAKLTRESGMDIARSALQSTGYEIVSYLPELGEVRTKVRAIASPAMCDCGTWNGNVVTGTANSTFFINVDSLLSDKTAVKANFQCGITFTGRNLYGGVTRVETLQCASTGKLEEQFWEKFRQIESGRRN